MDQKQAREIFGRIPAGSRLLVGVRQIRKALAAGNCQFVCLAADADPALVAPLERMCLRLGVPRAWIPTMGELGRVCGIEVRAAAAAITRKS